MIYIKLECSVSYTNLKLWVLFGRRHFVRGSLNTGGDLKTSCMSARRWKWEGDKIKALICTCEVQILQTRTIVSSASSILAFLCGNLIVMAVRSWFKAALSRFSSSWYVTLIYKWLLLRRCIQNKATFISYVFIIHLLKSVTHPCQYNMSRDAVSLCRSCII